MNGSDVTQPTLVVHLVGHVINVVHPDYIHTMQNTLFAVCICMHALQKA